MPPTIAELMDAMPDDTPPDHDTESLLRDLLQQLEHRQVPVGRVSRLFTLGNLQAQLAGAYLSWWLRSFNGDTDQVQRQLNETHLRSALKVIEGMGYLRGAIMKIGQLLAAWPEVMPDVFAEVLGRLHFEAPPMHFSLLREMVRRELGDDPECLFEEFETTAFAAASLGQVHRARLKGTGERVAIKIQYPGIVRTIRADVRNLKTAAFPMRLGGDWKNLQEQFDDIGRMLELETDYQQEAEHLRIALAAFGDDEAIVVPRVHEQWTTQRVLTMDYLDGVHLEPYLAREPPLAERDHFGDRIVTALMRLSYGKHLLYADPHPGNFL
ncbi:MAG: ABC1 kinase family protein, partial [Planctomycetota bacterium]